MAEQALDEQFKRFISRYNLAGEPASRLAHLITPIDRHFGQTIKSFYEEVWKSTGVTPKIGTHFHNNLKDKQAGRPEQKCALLFYVIKNYPHRYSGYQPAPRRRNASGDDLFPDREKLKGKPFWEIIPGLPTLEEFKEWVASDDNKDFPDNGVGNYEDKDDIPARNWWGLFTVENRSINENAYSLGLKNAQRVHSGNPVAALVELTVSPDYHDESGYEFGFGKMRVATDIRTHEECRIRIDTHYESPKAVGANAQATVFRSSPAGFVELTATSRVLNGGYYMMEPIFYVIPHEVPFEFSAELRAPLREMHIARPDGSEIPSDSKRAIMTALLAQELAGCETRGRWFVLAKLRLQIRSLDTDDTMP